MIARHAGDGRDLLERDLARKVTLDEPERFSDGIHDDLTKRGQSSLPARSPLDRSCSARRAGQCRLARHIDRAVAHPRETERTIELARRIVVPHRELEEGRAMRACMRRDPLHQRGCHAPAPEGRLDEQILHEQCAAGPAGVPAVAADRHADGAVLLLGHERRILRRRAEAVAAPIVLGGGCEERRGFRLRHRPLHVQQGRRVGRNGRADEKIETCHGGPNSRAAPTGP